METNGNKNALLCNAKSGPKWLQSNVHSKHLIRKTVSDSFWFLVARSKFVIPK